MIAQALRDRLGPSAPDDEAELARRFLSEARPVGSRLEVFREEARDALAATPTSDPIRTLQQVLALARASTLGCALVSEDGTARFDAIGRTAPTAVANSASNVNETAPRPRRPTFGMISSSVDDLIREIEHGTSGSRLRAWQQLGQEPLPDDLDANRARVLARYLLWGNKDVEEQARATVGLREITRPISVRLALADALGSGAFLPPRFDLISPDRLREVLGLILGRPIELRKFHHREDGRRLLIEDVLAEQGADPDELAGRYRDLYLAQAKLLGLGEGETLLTSKPSQILEALVNHVLPTLRADLPNLEAPERAALDRLPHEVIAADYLVGDELSRTVLFAARLGRDARRQARRRHAGTHGRRPSDRRALEGRIRRGRGRPDGPPPLGRAGRPRTLAPPSRSPARGWSMNQLRTSIVLLATIVLAAPRAGAVVVEKVDGSRVVGYLERADDREVVVRRIVDEEEQLVAIPRAEVAFLLEAFGPRAARRARPLGPGRLPRLRRGALREAE